MMELVIWKCAIQADQKVQLQGARKIDERRRT
jgi:hypothetical protein